MIQLFGWGSVNGWRQSGHGLLTLCFVLLGLGPAISGATPLGGLVKRDGGAGNHDVKIWVSRNNRIHPSMPLNIVWLNNCRLPLLQ